MAAIESATDLKTPRRMRFGQIAEPTLDHVEPRARSRHKMLVESFMAFEPRFDLRMLISGVIVHNQMQVQLGRGLLINQVQKLDPLLMPMAAHTRANNAPLGHLQSSQQGRGAVAFVVVGHGSQPSLDQCQTGLASVQCLYRCFLIGAQHQRVGVRRPRDQLVNVLISFSLNSIRCAIRMELAP